MKKQSTKKEVRYETKIPCPYCSKDNFVDCFESGLPHDSEYICGWCNKEFFVVIGKSKIYTRKVNKNSWRHKFLIKSKVE